MPWSRFDQTSTATLDALPASANRRVISFKDAMREAIDQAMNNDPRVFAIGLDADDKFGVFGSMLNLSHPERVIGTPVSENAMTGVALGAALNGMRPIYIHLRVDFMLLAMDQIANYIAKWRYMTRGKVKVPIVIRTVIGRGWGCGAQHSQTLGGMFAHFPGLKVVMPSDPYEAKGLFLAAVKDDWPVIFIEHRWLYKNTGAVPEEMYVLPVGKGRVVCPGKQLTLVATSLAVVDSLNAISKHELDVELIDPRWLKPLDEDLILNSVRKTGRLLVIDYDFPACGFAAEVCAMVAEKGSQFLKSPVQRMTFPDCPMPASGVLEKAYYPNADKIAERIRGILNGS
ncbi:MAG: alpha-ketoacid dehydrogenase subunit beta [Verrucomicrobia bacterium]|nr:MAG: alpha-ketoacid dehydrogenase subunit beta [Verrucomicrobiota bacterium]